MEALSNEVLKKQRELFEMQTCSPILPLLNALVDAHDVTVDLLFDRFKKTECVNTEKKQSASTVSIPIVVKTDQFMIQTRGPQARQSRIQR